MFKNFFKNIKPEEVALLNTIKYSAIVITILVLITYGFKFITAQSDLLNLLGVFLLVISLFWGGSLILKVLMRFNKDNESKGDSVN